MLLVIRAWRSVWTRELTTAVAARATSGDLAVQRQSDIGGGSF
jgi:hypothetical protein